MKRWTWMLLAGVLVVALAGAVGCGDDDDEDEDGGVTPQVTVPAGGETPGAGGDGGTTVEVQLKEFEIVLDADSAPAGEVTFRAENIGPDDEHELVIIQSDLEPGALPTDEDGSVPEDEVDLIDEIEPFAVGETEEITVDLEAGSYVLICNIVEEEEGETESHYQLGMRTAFTVE